MASYNKKRVKENLTHPQFVVLASLAYLSQTNDEVTQVMISKLSGIDVMTASQILSLLEKHAYVERKEHSRDSRAKAVILKKKGEEILQKAVPVIEQIDELFFGKLVEDEEHFKHLLVRLNEE